MADSWWTRCPICGSPTSAGPRPFWLRFCRWFLRHPILWGLDVPVPNPQSFDRICPTHGRVSVHRLRHGATKCQRCGYELHGCGGDACPECGWDIPVAMRDALARRRVDGVDRSD